MNDQTAYAILRNLLTETAPYTGDAFLKAAVKSFARQFEADFVFITQLIDAPADTVRMLAAWRDGAEIAGWEFALPGTPCELIYQDEEHASWDGMRVGDTVALAENVCRQFASTKDTTYESFIGFPLRSGDHKMIGHVALFFRRRLPEGAAGTFMLELAELFSYRVQAELNRILLEQAREATLEELKDANVRLAHETITDLLTQLHNRRYFTRRLQQSYTRFKRSGEQYALMLLDLDYFKKINDEYGHDIGDAVLRKMAEVFSTNTRIDIEMVFRIGGEEFAMLCHGTNDAVSLQALGERINAAVRAAEISIRGATIRTSVSIGFTIPRADDAGWDTIYARADKALYKAKNEGRDRTEFEA
ncbi:hypothetical protein BH11PSE11_BH11PSE11_32950 [soil metagenome]